MPNYFISRTKAKLLGEEEAVLNLLTICVGVNIVSKFLFSIHSGGFTSRLIRLEPRATDSRGGRFGEKNFEVILLMPRYSKFKKTTFKNVHLGTDTGRGR